MDEQPVASTSPAPPVDTADGGAAQPSEAGRAKRSRRDRPCDLCRRQKHQCIIPVKGEPCKTCRTRNRPCTFDAPPVVRIRKPKPDAPEAESQPPIRESSTFSSDSPFSPAASSDTLLSLIRIARKPRLPTPPLDEASASESRLSPGGGRVELSYLSTNAFSDSTFSVEEEHASSYPGDVGFRQVSNDPSFPVFFVETPSLMYGTAAPAGERLWRAAVAVLTPDAPAELVRLYLAQTQPAFPVLEEFHTTDPAALAASGVSFGVLTSLLAHSTAYVTNLRPHHKLLWRQVLLSLEDEYRNPTLQTIQLGLITIASRPALNVGQNTIAMGRLISAAQLLGLHLDCSRWKVPAAERRIRTRLWWAIVIHDKWRSALYGRPSNVSLDDTNVPLPNLDETVDPNSPEAVSYNSFLAMCKLSVILDSVLSNFFTVRALTTPKPVSARLRALETIAFDVAELERELTPPLLSLPNEADATPAPTGVRAFQLCKIGLDLIILRLTTSTCERPTPAQQAASFQAALSLAQTLVEFLENLTLADYSVFWWPYCSFIISSAAALLLRTALTAKPFDQTTRTTSGVLFTRLVVTLTSSHHAARWDVASLALDRIATLLRSLQGELPELVPLLQLFGPPNHANTGPPAPPTSQQAAPPRPSISPQQAQQLPLPPLVSPSLPRPPGSSLSPSLAHQAPAYPPPTPATTWSCNQPSYLPPPPLPSATAATMEQHTSPSANSAAGELDSLWWMQTEILSLPEHFGDLPDAFEGWENGFNGSEGDGPAGYDGELAGPPGVGGAEGQEGVFDLLRFLQGPGTPVQQQQQQQ
ncbi:hypothetical protein JCM8547_004109 [Rhodosporidiobolus lusitaniae]